MTIPREPIGSIPRPLTLVPAVGGNAQAIIRTVQHPLVVLDDKLSVTTANESFYRTFHVSPKETEGRLIYDLGERQWDIPKLRTLLEEILLGNSQFHDFEVEHEFENIGPKRMLLKARRLDQRGDRSQLILLAIEDITERKHAEESLLENEERYRTLFNLSPMAVYTIDASGVILEFNRHAAELWGREPALGDTDQRFCGSFKMFRPDGSFMPHEQCPMAEVVSGKVSEVHNGEVRIERPDGSHVTVIVNIRPLKNDRGEVTGAINCFYDITERKRAETLILFQKEAFEMAASGASLAQVLEFLARTAEGQSQQGALIAIHLLDETGTCFDQTFAPSLPASYALATNGMNGTATGPCCAAIARRERVAVANVASSQEFPAFAAFALPLGIHAGWSTPIFSSTGKVIGTFASYYHEPREPTPQDNLLGEVLTRTASVIIERKRAEEELKNLMRKEQAARAEAEAANRVKDEFLAIVSHELRTPLNAIVGWTHLLKNGKLGQRESERAIQTIGRNATAQAAIISELLDVSRIVSGKLKLDMKPVDLADVINEAVDVVRAAADAKGIEVVTSLDQKAGLVAGESVRLQQVIWNLLTNAIKFTPKGGSVKVQLERADSHVAVAVSDTGTGIPPEFLPYVFERFQQADSSEKRTHGGLGLGLSIVRNLVEMHGGSVSAESKGEGRGARFTVTLPILAVSGSRDFLQASRDPSSELPGYGEAQDGGDAEEHQDMDLEPDFLSGVKVLAVDDQADTRDLIIIALTRYGAEVRACTSAIEACKTIKKWQPHVIVSDIGMPDEDGYDLMRKVRALAPENGGQIPAIALTGYAASVDESKAYAAGYQVHITKPVELRELARTVAKLSGRQSTPHMTPAHS